jgi:ATP synthase protein I
VEVVSALVVGVGIGWALDRWLGTWPWLFLVFFVMGSAAGVLNVYRLFNPRSRPTVK